MKIIKFENKKHKDIWDQFILQSNNGTIFHLRKFLSYHIDRDFNDCSLMFCEREKIVAVFTGAIVDETLISHPGASFGGFVYNDVAFKDFNIIVNLLINFSSKNNLKEIKIIPPPFIYYKNYNEAMEYCLYSNNFQIEENYISSFVELYDDIEKNIHARKRRYIKKNESLIEIKQTKNLDDFFPILIKNKLRHNTKPTHSFDELQSLINKFPSDIVLLLSYYKNKAIGGSLIFKTNQFSCILFYNMIDYKYKDLQVASIQVYKSMLWAKLEGLKYFDIGVSQLYDKNKIIPHESLISFKEKFGAKAMIRKVLIRKI